MARVFQRPGDREWWLDYADAEGKRRRVKTTTTSKREAEDLLAELRADRKREQLGLDVAIVSKVKTIGEAWEKWLDNWCPEGSQRRERGRFRANVRGKPIAALRLAQVSGETLDKWFAECLKAGQSPRTVNGHRRILRCIYNTLVRKRLYRGANPVKETKPLDEPERAYQLLTEIELKRLLPHVPQDWRDLVHLGFATGLRRGELYALRKDRTVVDLERATLTPRASNERDMPKGKKVKSIPLTPDAVELLRRAWDEAEPGGLLYPGPLGAMRSQSAKTAEMIRSAMVRAGLVEGWRHVCRWGCDVDQLHPDEQQRKCPVCTRFLWPKPIVREVRFHDLRHSTADYLLDRGVDMADVSQMMRHSSLEITNKVYRHRTVEALRKAITKPSVGTLERQLELLAAGQPPEVAAVLNEAREKLALARHQETNVVPLRGAKTT
jgi:integrase